MPYHVRNMYTFIIAIFAVIAGCFGILQAEDRWNQSGEVKALCYTVENMQSNMEIWFLESRLQQYIDEQFYIRLQIAENPNIVEYRERLDYLNTAIKDTQGKLERLKAAERKRIYEDK